MPRPERPVNPVDGVAQRFAMELRKLRREAGNPTYRELAGRTGYSVSTLSDAAAGRRLPTLDVALAYATACGGDREDWRGRWHAATLADATPDAAGPADAAGSSGPDSEPIGSPPYRGLASFRDEDAGLFFGRERLVALVTERIEQQPLTIVLGPSGAGKTSLLRAGVVPAMRERARAAGVDLRVVHTTPAREPWAELGPRLAELVGSPPAGSADVERLIVIDQLEELFTVRTSDERAAFLDGILAVSRGADRCRTVLAVRADFYGACAEHPGLAEVLGERHVLVGHMDRDGLREAIGKPAAAVGMSVERALVTAVLGDAERHPGALPLISHAMLETWRRRRGEVLTLAGYQAAGGVAGAVVQTAEATYGALDPEQQRVAAELMLRLTVVEEDVVATRRRLAKAELLDAHPDAADVLDRLADARLVTLDEDTVEIAHESLIRHWPRLRDWVAEDREGLRVHYELSEATRTWLALGHDPDALYRGTRLAIAVEWAQRAASRTRLSGTERAFLDASTDAADRRQAAERRRTALRRRLIAALAVFSALALLAGVVAIHQYGRAVDARQESLSQLYASQALDLAPGDVRTAIHRALDAYEAAPTPEARSAVLSLAGKQAFTGKLVGTGRINALTGTSDGTELISGNQDGTVTIWDPAVGRPVRTLDHRSPVRAVALTPDGTIIAAAGVDGTISLWRRSDGTRVGTVTGHTGGVESLAFSPDSRTLASTDDTRTTLVDDVATGVRRARIPGRGGRDSAVAISPDGHALAIAGDDGAVTVHDVATGALRERLPAGGAPLRAVAFHPEDGSIAAGGDDRAIYVWDGPRRNRTQYYVDTSGPVHDLAFDSTGETVYCGCARTTALWDVRHGATRINLGGHADAVFAVTASAGGELIASAGADQSILLWRRAELPLAKHTRNVTGLAVDSTGDTLASASADGTTVLWGLADRRPRTVLTGHRDRVTGVAYHPDGTRLATASADHAIALWDPRTGDRLAALTGHTDIVNAVSFTPRGLLASGGADGRVVLWNPSDSDQGDPVTIATHRQPVTDVQAGPDGRAVASAGQDGTVMLSDLTAPGRTTTLETSSQDITALAYSRDGRRLAAGNAVGDVLVWDTARLDTPPARLHTHTGAVETLTFSPDGNLLASGGLDHDVVLTDLADHAPVATLTGHTDKVLSSSFSPDGRVLYTGSADHTIIPWTIDPETARDRLCHRLATDFTPRNPC